MWDTITTWIGDHWIISSIIAFLALVFLRDVTQTRRAIRRNFPIVGNLRYMLESIGPELRQYWVANDKEEAPFNRAERRWVYTTAKDQNKNFGFGTTEDTESIGYPIIKHSTLPFPDTKAPSFGDDETSLPCTKVIGESHGRRRPYRPPSIINISAMSYGSLGRNAVSAMNRGCKAANCFQNTGEGGISPYHRLGGDIVWQIGTGYFGARGPDGSFSMDKVVEQAENTPTLRAIEVKLSQGAKPGKGGILPGEKVTAEIAEIRGIPVGETCVSPNHHLEFDTVDAMIDYIETMADRTGLPVGIKSAIGKIEFWDELARRMKERGEGPDFIAIDGGEGGTGAAPLAFTDHVALPFDIAMARVYPIFQAAGVSGDVVWIGSSKLGFPDRAITALAMGCDMINVAREAMLAVGCIQAQICHTGHCPAGLATHNKWLQRGLDVEDKAIRLARYVKGFRKELIQLAHAAGYEHPARFTGRDVEVCTAVGEFTPMAELLGYDADPVTIEL